MSDARAATEGHEAREGHGASEAQTAGEAGPPLVGVGIPTWRPRPRHLRDALDALLAQTLTRWRAVIVDDASPDDVRSIVAPYLADRRVRFLRGQARRGIAGNANACIAALEGPYVQLLFQDDVWEPRYLERTLAALEAHPTAGMAFARRAYVDDSGRPGRSHIHAAFLELQRALVPAGALDGAALLDRWTEVGLNVNLIGEPSFVLLRRAAIEAAGGFRDGLPQLLDAECWIRLLARGPAVHVAETLGRFRLHGDAASARNHRNGRGALDGFACYQRLLEILPEGGPRERALTRLDRQIAALCIRLVDALLYGHPSDPRLRAFLAFCARHPGATARGLLQYAAGLAARWRGRVKALLLPPFGTRGRAQFLDRTSEGG